MRALSSLILKTTDYTFKLIFGRWLVVFESGRRFVLHDADPVTGKHTWQVLWEQETPQVSEWDLKSILSPEGHCVVYVFLKLRGPPGWYVPLVWWSFVRCIDGLFCRKLLEIRLNYDTGELLHLAPIDPPHDGSDISLRVTYTGNSQLLFIPTSTKDHMVLDTRTHVFYKVPLSTKV